MAFQRLIAGFQIERAFSAPSPQQQRVAGYVVTSFADQIQQSAVDGRTIVVGEIDQSSLLYEAAQFDQVTSAFAT